MPRPWKVLIALLPFALHGLAREVDTAVGLLLKARTPPDPFLPEVVWVLAASAPGSIARVALWTFGGALLWLVLAALGGRREGRGRADAAGHAQGDPPGGRGPDEGRGFSAALARGAGSFGPLYLRPMLTVLALGSLALRPSFPYAFTLPVALGQDWGPAQDVAALAALVALRC
ncbi:MAG TPA: hypothetical protein VLI67_03195, partial [Vicinamibacteria bacterium]|nr:hypothetical protein [Vicinamibacteria bacterium]